MHKIIRLSSILIFTTFFSCDKNAATKVYPNIKGQWCHYPATNSTFYNKSITISSAGSLGDNGKYEECAMTNFINFSCTTKYEADATVKNGFLDIDGKKFQTSGPYQVSGTSTLFMDLNNETYQKQ